MLSPLLHFLRTIIAPYFCRSCRIFLSADHILCTDCMDHIELLASTIVHVTGTVDMKVFALGPYRDPLRFLILAKGWSDRTAAWQLGTLSWRLTNVRFQDFDCIVPVPLHWKRHLTRGFNQAEVMARAISALSNKPVVRLVKRSQSTNLQSILSAAHRLQNVKNAFVLDDRLAQKYYGKRILLIDDLMTTGATLQAVGKALLPLKSPALMAVVAARVTL